LSPGLKIHNQMASSKLPITL